MKVLVASHGAALEHDTGEYHPERPDRVRAVLRGVEDSGLDVVHIESPEITPGELAVVHDPEYIAMVKHLSESGGGAIDMDTVTSRASWEAALRAAGGVTALVEELATESEALGLAITRPPGHHALRDKGMGFCLFNNVAVAAALLRAENQRVAILDWDVHHGNGTQALLGDDPGVLYVSLHQSPYYPYEGRVEDINLGEAKGTNVNIPVPAGTAGGEYRRAWQELVIPIVDQFEPDWILVSSGYDAHILDPLADLGLVAEDYGFLASRLREVVPTNRVIVALEGGYSLEGLQHSTAATLSGLGGTFESANEANDSPEASKRAIDAAAQIIADHWSI